MKKFKVLLILLAVSIIGCSSASKKDVNYEPIMFASTSKGKVIAINHNDLHYFMRIDSKSMKWKKTDKRSYMFLIDKGRILKLINSQFENLKKYKGKITDRQILAKYNSMELDYFTKIYGDKVKYNGKFFNFKNSTAVYWTIELPEDAKNVPKKYLSISIVKNGQDVITVSTVPGKDSEKTLRYLLLKTITTLVVHPVPISRNYFNVISKAVDKK